MRVQAYRNTCTESCERHGEGMMLAFEPWHGAGEDAKGRSEEAFIDLDDGYKVVQTLRGDKMVFRTGVNEPGIPIADAVASGIAKEVKTA